MMEKLLNKIRKNCCWWVWRRKSFTWWRCWSWKKMRMKYFHMTKKMTKLDRSENYMFCMSWLKQQQQQQRQQQQMQKLYVLQCICQKIVQKDTNILKKKLLIRSINLEYLFKINNGKQKSRQKSSYITSNNKWTRYQNKISKQGTFWRRKFWCIPCSLTTTVDISS